MAEVSFVYNTVTQKALDTDATARIELTKNGVCPKHPDICLRKKKLFKWKPLRDECPVCADERKREKKEKQLLLFYLSLVVLLLAWAWVLVVGRVEKKTTLIGRVANKVMQIIK
mmetsp:Transcript_34288/g.51181  ORF Transcript_34288/g.51181 Transcript_34288/m.51181 type:complete len:114 (-) Transcript_34288:115-456(-)